MASIGDYPRTLLTVPTVLDQSDSTGNPAWLFLGWIWLESAGKIGDADYTASGLGGELGLMQLSADERSLTGFTDTGKMTGTDDASELYQIQAGSRLIDIYGGRAANVGVTQDNDPFYWMFTKLQHGMGSGGAMSILNNYIADNGSVPDSWEIFRSYADDHPYSSASYTGHHCDNTESVRSNGLALATAAGVVSIVPPAVTALIPSAGLVLPGLVLAGLITGFWYYYGDRNRS